MIDLKTFILTIRIMRIIICIERKDAMKFREVEKQIIADGWYHVKQKGSHHQYRHPTKPGKVTIPEHPGDIHIDTVKSIFRQAGL